jgi:hypothetical protein
MPQILPIRLRRPVIICFLNPEASDLNHLLLIPFCIPRVACRLLAHDSPGNRHGRPQGPRAWKARLILTTNPQGGSLRSACVIS